MKSPLKSATKWLREFARTYLPSNAELEYDPHDLREAGVYLADLTCFFRRGRVVKADKLDAWGACWLVEGRDCDDNELRASLNVHTQEMKIKINWIKRLKRLDDQAKEQDNDAA